MSRMPDKAYDLVAAFIANIRYEAMGDAGDLLMELIRDYEMSDRDGAPWTEKHTDRVLTHDEVAVKTLHNAVAVIMEQMDMLRDVAP